MKTHLVNDAVMKLIDLALKEDLGPGDVTSKALFSKKNPVVQGKILAKEPLLLAGMEAAEAVFRKVDPKIVLKRSHQDGDKVSEGNPILSVKGKATSVLAAERIALNFLQHLSGIATFTYQFLQTVRGTAAQILDTRKTLPGWRRLEKHAVKMGGGQNHRMGLYDAYLIKDNHLALSGSVSEAIKSVRAVNRKPLKVEVEVTSLDGVDGALGAGVDWILLDNMPLEDMHLAVIHRNRRARVIQGRKMPLLEASGSINLDNARAVAQTGGVSVSLRGSTRA